MDYIAHIRSTDGKIQTVAEHLLEVKALAEDYGSKLGVQHMAGLAGMLHDLGKYTPEFMEYITLAVQNPDAPPKRGSVDHATAGGRLLFNLFHNPAANGKYTAMLAEIISNCIISHHGYLHDYISPELQSTYLKRVRDKELLHFDEAVELFFQHIMTKEQLEQYVIEASKELETILHKNENTPSEQTIMLLTKFIFSMLLDADRTNTRCFEEAEEQDESTSFNVQVLFQTYYDRLIDTLENYAIQEDADTPINKLRAEMSQQCENFAGCPSGIYTLSIPTGGGKTLASFRYGLRHAIKYNKKTIIYVVPYTTIIEQNANELRKIVQDDRYILEHHSNIVIPDQDDNNDENEGIMNLNQQFQLARDNWNYPIIFTTMVQFLNAFYEDGTRNIRRLHHLSDAVIIFDEVQKVPVTCISLFNQAVNFLDEYANSSILLCTATQPELDFVKHKLNIQPQGEIVSDLHLVTEKFKRVNVIDHTEDGMTTESLTEFVLQRSREHISILIILNTKGVVRALYDRLKQEDSELSIYHLSTSMCATHRFDILDKIKDDLKNKRPVICISTQLIEAGVDISFECVIRSLAGLDSIAQAAGRCNRHGENKFQPVYVIHHMEEKIDALAEIQKGQHITGKIFTDLRRNPNEYGGNVLSFLAMRKYFQEFYTEFNNKLDYPIAKLQKTMTQLLTGTKVERDSYYMDYMSNNKQSGLPLFLVNSYKTAAEHFQVIEEKTTAVLVPYGEGKEIIADLNGQHNIKSLSALLRKAQRYMVNIYPNEKEKLSTSGSLVSYLDGKVLALKGGSYDENYGINLEGDSFSPYTF
ncbi:CRISPR-associated helicase Cas3' [Paenibacillus turicensis]|uniref:CRISPR-associated helicase Cas3' n=1 Tax=Paenibacillus turicensis TaxID=160487 RepID=UPI003D273F70